MSGKPQVMPYSEVPWAHWGIHTRYAYSVENARKIAQKVWDPLSSPHIQLGSHNGNNGLIDKVYGRYSLISAIRGARPVQTQPSSNNGSAEEIFAPIIRGDDYGIVVARGKTWSENPFSAQPKLENISGEEAATIINKFGSYARIVDPEVEQEIRKQLNGHSKIAYGINLVTIPTQYVEKMEDVAVRTLAAMLDSSRNALQYIWEEAQKTGRNFVPFNNFFNIGPNAGGTLKRLHSQTYVDLNEDGHGATLESLLKSSEHSLMNGGCALCNHYLNDYKISGNDESSMYASPSPIRNYEILIAPNRHFEDLTMASFGELEAISEMLIKASAALNDIGANCDRNILIYQRPFGYNSKFHTLIRVIPFEYVGGQEMMDDSRVARIDPLDVAGAMRETISNIPKLAIK